MSDAVTDRAVFFYLIPPLGKTRGRMRLAGALVRSE